MVVASVFVLCVFLTYREVGSDVFYSTLAFFQNDWLNKVWSVRQDVQDDYRFVYMGPKGTWYTNIQTLTFDLIPVRYFFSLSQL